MSVYDCVTTRSIGRTHYFNYHVSNHVIGVSP